MGVRRTGNPAASASHTGKRGEKSKKSRFYFNKRSCMAMAVSAALLLASVDCMAVRAEESADVLLPAAEEENTEISGSTEASDAAPLIISTFRALEEEVSRIELEERESLEDVRKRMPETLIANVVLVSSMEDEMNPDEVEQPVEGEMKPCEGEKKSGMEEERPDAGDDGNNSDMGEDDHRWRFLVETGESGADHAGSETDSADSDAGDNNGGEESEGEGDSTGSAESGSEDGSTGGAEDGSEDSNIEGVENGNGDAGSGTGEGSTDEMAGGNDTDMPAVGEGENPDTTAPSADDVSLEAGEVEVPVTWECGNYDTEELDVYTFVPKWDETKWAFEESEEHKLPTIEVVYMSLLPVGEGRERMAPAVAGRKEIYISASRDSGYSAMELLELKEKLEELGYTVISSKRTEIDTTDLRNWDVYDHYDMDLWPGGNGSIPSAAWSSAYAGYRKRPYYPCVEYQPYWAEPTPPATTIQEWLAYLKDGQYMDGTPQLAHFKEHIFSREEDGKAAMTFVGYGMDPYKDFLFYNPQSSGEKVVSFDVDSSKVYTHTLEGNGFLINAGEKDGVLKGYLVFYTYSYNGMADSITLYRLNEGVKIDDLHAGMNGINGYRIDSYAELKASQEITDWKPEMSIKIKVTPDKVQIWQQEKTGVEIDEEKTDAFVSWDLEDTGYNGYGPLVAYHSHCCYEASSFTYSNLYMYFTDPDEERKDMLSSLAEADFTQDDTQKYFINLFGDDNLEYGEDDFRQYQGFLKMMQEEGIALITDRNAPFEEYLGSANNSDNEQNPGNLLELKDSGPGNKLQIDDLVQQIDAYLKDRKSTSLKETVDNKALTEANPGQSVGNIWLRSVDDGKQVRDRLDGNSFGDSGLEIRIMDDIAWYNGSRDDYYGNKDDCKVIYEIQKPGDSGYYSKLENSFLITKNQEDWPGGSYTVRQTIIEGGNECVIQGYAYFDLYWSELPVVPPTYLVTVNVKVKKDGADWNDHGREFKLLPEGGGTLINPSEAVPAGTYDVYDVTESAEGVGTGVSVTVQNAEEPDAEITTEPVDYYTVTFYDKKEDGVIAYPDGTPLAPKIVLKGQTISRPGPGDEPSRPSYEFAGWVTQGGGSEVYDFRTPIIKKTDIYASWTYPVAVKVTVRKDSREWNDHGRHFMLRPEDGEDLKEPFLAVPTGKYVLYDVTGLKEGVSLTEDRNTGRLIEVKNAETPDKVEEVTVDYYTVTFYDEKSADKKPCESGAEQNPQVILKNQRAGRPAFEPTKDQYAFAGWVTVDGTKFNFDSGISNPTEIYANWEKVEEPKYKVTVNVGKDGGEWKDSGRIFALRPENGDEELVFNFAQVEKGTYRVYDITGGNRSRAAGTAMDAKVDDGDTGVTVTVENKDETATVDYYTVTFYDGEKAYGTDTPQSPTVVLRGKRAAEPPAPDKEGYQFTGWRTEDGGSTAFDFDQAIVNKTDIYAGWDAVRGETVTDKKPGRKHIPDDGGGTGDTQTVMVRQEAAPQAGTSETGSTSIPALVKTLFGGREPYTGDMSRIEIYAAVALAAGLVYLLLYIREKRRRGVTGGDKEVFAAELVRWAKKVCGFGK